MAETGPETAPETGPVAGRRPAAARPRVVAAAVVARRRWKVVEVLDEVVASGGSGLMICVDGTRDSELDERVEVLDLSAVEQRTGLNAVLSRSPVRLARRLSGQEVSGPSWAWARWSGFKGYRVARPWVLWRALRKQLDAVDVDHVDHIVLVGQESWPIAWHLCRRNPEITVGWDVPDEVYQRAGRTPVRVESPARED